MKKLLTTGKKSLSVFLAIIMMLTIAAPAAFAADAVICDEHDYVKADPVAPTCDSQGYTLYVCKNCGVTVKKELVDALGHDFDDGVYKNATCTEAGGTTFTCKNGCGFSYFVKDKDAPATGHKWSDWHIFKNPNDATVFANMRNCLNDGCTEKEYEKDSEGNINVYYEVEFINDEATDKTVVAKDGTVLRETSKEEVLDTVYALKGTEAKYTGDRVFIDSTDKFGFIHNGWAVKDERGHKTDASSLLGNVESNLKVYVNLRAYTPVYDVSFSNANGKPLTAPQRVAHGTKVQYPFAQPADYEDVFNHYEFEGWSKRLPGDKNGATVTHEEMLNLEIYSGGTYVAQFNTIPKKFKVIYEFEGLTDNTDVVIYGGKLDKLVNPVGEFKNISKPNDEAYIYEFSGKWMLENGTIVDENNFSSVTPGLKEYDPNKENDEKLTDAQKGIIRLYPYFYRMTQKYSFNLNVFDVDGDTPAANGNVQILDASGQFVTGKKLDKDGRAHLELDYGKKYTLQMNCNGNVKEAVIYCHYLWMYKGDVKVQAPHIEVSDNLPNTGDTDSRIIPCVNTDGSYAELFYTLEEDSVISGDDEAPHNCICHTFFARPWITFLNMIYNLFGRKIVCCVDMYERHGDILVYTR